MVWAMHRNIRQSRTKTAVKIIKDPRKITHRQETIEARKKGLRPPPQTHPQQRRKRLMSKSTKGGETINQRIKVLQQQKQATQTQIKVFMIKKD